MFINISNTNSLFYFWFYPLYLLDNPNRKKYKPSGFLGWIFGTGRPSPAEITEAFNKHYGEGTVTDIIPSDVISIKYKEHGDIIIHYFDNDLNHK